MIIVRNTGMYILSKNSAHLTSISLKICPNFLDVNIQYSSCMPVCTCKFYVYCADLKDPCVMETAGCHVTLMNAINQSGLMDKYNHSQRFKVIQVQKK